MAQEQQKAEPRKSTAPSTSSVLWGEWRRGLKDLQDAVLTAFPDSRHSLHEAGTIANPTSVEIYHQRQDSAPGRKVEPAAKAEAVAKPEAENPGPLEAARARAGELAAAAEQQKGKEHEPEVGA